MSCTVMLAALSSFGHEFKTVMETLKCNLDFCNVLLVQFVI